MSTEEKDSKPPQGPSFGDNSRRVQITKKTCLAAPRSRSALRGRRVVRGERVVLTSLCEIALEHERQQLKINVERPKQEAGAVYSANGIHTLLSKYMFS